MTHYTTHETFSSWVMCNGEVFAKCATGRDAQMAVDALKLLQHVRETGSHVVLPPAPACLVEAIMEAKNCEPPEGKGCFATH